MSYRTVVVGLVGCFALAVGLTSVGAQQAGPAGMMSGSVELESVGPIAFGPDGVLFVADSVGAAIVAIDTGDTAMGSGAAEINVENIDAKIAALVGTTPDQIMIADRGSADSDNQVGLRSQIKGQL